MNDTNENASTLERNQNKSGSYKPGTSKELFISDDEKDSVVDMGVADGALSLILDMLSDISSNRGAYVLREAYSNAYDAVRATGDMSNRIDITIPSADMSAGSLASKLSDGDTAQVATVVVEDHGIGMSEDDTRSSFVQYGGSKKRSSVASIGSQALGSKAPLAVTDTFEVVSRKNGVETSAVISKSGDKSFARIVSQPTEEGNGTKVIIPVSDMLVVGQMQDCARKLARWNIDANLFINGEHADGIDPDGYTFFGNVCAGNDESGNPVSFDVYHDESNVCRCLDSNYSSPTFEVIIGGYPYELTSHSGYRSSSNRYVVVGAPGYLNFTPSRDDIRDDDAAQRFYDGVLDGMREHGFSEYINNSIVGKDVMSAFSFIRLASTIGDVKDGVRNVSFDYGSGDVPADAFVFDGHDISHIYSNSTSGSSDVIRREFVDVSRYHETKSRNFWRCNGSTHRSSYDGSDSRLCQQISKSNVSDAVSDASANGSLVSISNMLFDSDRCRNTYACVVTGCDMSDVSELVGVFNHAETEIVGCEPPADTMVHMFLTDDSTFTPDSFESDVSSKLLCSPIVVMSYRELVDKAIARRKASRASRSSYVKRSDTACRLYSFDFSYGANGSVTGGSTYESQIPLSDVSDDVAKDNLFVFLGNSSCEDPDMFVRLAYAVARRKELGYTANGVVIVCSPLKREVEYLVGMGVRVLCDMRRTQGKSQPSINDTCDLFSVRNKYDYNGKFCGQSITISTKLLLTDDEVTGKYVSAFGVANRLRTICDDEDVLSALYDDGRLDGTPLGDAMDTADSITADGVNAIYAMCHGDVSVSDDGDDRFPLAEYSEECATIDKAIGILSASGLTMLYRSNSGNGYAYDEEFGKLNQDVAKCIRKQTLDMSMDVLELAGAAVTKEGVRQPEAA